MKKLLATLVLGASALAALGAQAVAINGTFAASSLGATSYVGANLNSASQLNVAGTFVTTSLNATYLGNPNDLVGLMNIPDIGTIAGPIVITGFTPVTNFLVWGTTTTPTSRFSFDLLTLTRNPSSSGVMDLYGTGTFHDGTASYSDSAAAFRLTAQEIGGSTSYSFSWGSPPFDNPAPGALSLMAAGLLALGAARRRVGA